MVKLCLHIAGQKGVNIADRDSYSGDVVVSEDSRKM